MSKATDFRVKMSMPYEFKKAYAETRINEFIRECGKRNLNCYVSVGGLDSITLLCFIRSLGYTIDGVSVSAIEHKSVRKIHRQLNVIEVKPLKSKYHILKEYGYPILSKEIALKIDTLNNPTDKNETYRNAIITGIKGNGEHSDIVKLPDKWLQMFYYNKCDIPISSKCCYYIKEKPCQDWAAEHNAVPFVGLQASESQRRFLSLSRNGCNYFSKRSTRSAPFAIFNKSDVIHLACELNVPIPEIYGNVVIDEQGNYKTTGNSRTGCDICGFGIQFEKTRPHRFDILHDEDFQKWDFFINKMQYGQLFDYIGFDYHYPYETGAKAWTK